MAVELQQLSRSMFDERLLGRWRSVAGTTDETATVEFDEQGSLMYTIRGLRSDQKFFLRYRTDGGVIVSDQPSAPREERTTYRFTPEGHLVMTYKGEESIYERDG
jgi:hypothetical protein